MANISQERIQEIRQNADIVEIISSYIPLIPKGKNFFGVCPFHEDHSPSMSVSREKQLYKCFSCGAGGNVFQFVKEYENIDFLKAVSIVANKIGMDFSYQKNNSYINKYQDEYEIMQLASLFYNNNIMSSYGIKAKEYLQKRNITDEIIKTFNIGLSLNDNSLTTFLQKKKKNINTIKDLGLVKENNFETYDLFHNRIMFPIENIEGQVVGFTGRVYLDNDTPKYLNTKETKLFKKGKILYNYHRAKEYVHQKKALIIVEGNMDAIRMSASGFQNTVALMGTSLTNDQIELIKKLRVKIILMLDNDQAGKINTYQNGLLLEKNNILLEVVRLTNAKDPDEFIKTYGKEAMQDEITHSISFLEFKLNYLKDNKNLNDAKDLASYIKEVIKSLNNNDNLTKEITIKKLAKEYDLSYDLLKEQLDSEIKPTIVKKNIKNESPPKKSRYLMCAQRILYGMMSDLKIIKMYQKELNYFLEKQHRQVANEIIDYYEKNKTISLVDFLSYAELSPIKDDILQITNSIKDENITENNIEESILMMKEIMIEKEIKDLKKQLKESLDINAKIKIGLKMTELCRQKNELKKERSVNND